MRSLDIAPTILDAVGIRSPADFEAVRRDAERLEGALGRSTARTLYAAGTANLGLVVRLVDPAGRPPAELEVAPPDQAWSISCNASSWIA